MTVYFIFYSVNQFYHTLYDHLKHSIFLVSPLIFVIFMFSFEKNNHIEESRAVEENRTICMTKADSRHKTACRLNHLTDRQTYSCGKDLNKLNCEGMTGGMTDTRCHVEMSQERATFGSRIS